MRKNILKYIEVAENIEKYTIVFRIYKNIYFL